MVAIAENETVVVGGRHNLDSGLVGNNSALATTALALPGSGFSPGLPVSRTRACYRMNVNDVCGTLGSAGDPPSVNSAKEGPLVS